MTPIQRCGLYCVVMILNYDKGSYLHHCLY